MIIGIGSDIIDIRRIEAAIEKRGERFLARLYTDIERKRSDGKLGRVASYAKRFAAKEACSKALGTGMNRGVAWRDMGVVNRPGGAPTMALTGGALARLQALTPAQLNEAAKLLDTGNFTWVVVGDRKTVEPQLKQLGLPVEERQAPTAPQTPR